MTKVTLTKLSSLVNGVTAINGVLTQIEEAFDNTLSRDGDTPNQLTAPLDANDQVVFNLPLPATPTQAASKAYVDEAVLGGVTLSSLVLQKVTPSGTAPGAGLVKLEVVAGTNAGTAKLIIYAGTSATPLTIIDNVGSGF
jgi:FMN-dependent NADH-azoreductase